MKHFAKLLCLATLCLPASSALASTVDFSFAFSGTGISGSGTLIASTTATPGQYLITGVTGTVDGSFITGLIPVGDFPTDYPPANDNLFYNPATGGGFLDDSGFSFADAAGLDFNLFFGPNSDFDTSAGYQYVTGVGTLSDGGALKSFTVAATPEPSSLALLGSGLLGVVGMLRRRLS